jgi:hypothetical protein
MSDILPPSAPVIVQVKSPFRLKLEGSIYFVIGGLPVLVTYLGAHASPEDKPITWVGLLAAFLGMIVAGAISLKAFLSTSSQTPSTPEIPLAADRRAAPPGQ